MAVPAWTADVYTDAFDSQPRLGREVRTADGNVYMFLKGVASSSAGSWVTYDENYTTTLLAANAVGPVAIAMGAAVANEFGWFQVYGFNTISKSDTTVADVALYIDGTAGRVDDAVVAGDLVIGANSTAADTANVLPVWINRPFVTNVLG